MHRQTPTFDCWRVVHESMEFFKTKNSSSLVGLEPTTFRMLTCGDIKQNVEIPFLPTRVFWAKKLYERIRDPQWQYRMVHPVIRGQHCDRTYNRDMNLILVKLHLLDPTQVFPAFNQLRKGELPAWWRHQMETFSVTDPLCGEFTGHFRRHWIFVRGIHRSPVNFPHNGQWLGALMFSLICALTYGWVNNRDAGDLRRTHYVVTGMVNTWRIIN